MRTCWGGQLKSFAEVEEATRDLITGELAPPDIVWEMQHARTKQGVLVWANPQSQEIHGRIQQLVNEQAELPVEEPRMSRDEILASVLGERSGYVRGKEMRAEREKDRVQMRTKICAEREAEREEDRVQMHTKIRADMRAEREAEREEDRVQMRTEIRAEMEQDIDRRIKAQLGALMAGLQQGQFQASGSNSAENSPVGAQSK
ncbi:uncharacterized protein G2W53_007875 [Senna tora]|uniref:Uncharacterized protein n=1 Tax=Senna tora TaxID=362788 RepID=A0A834X649_9FABA|nr:uncharacterized protein G2W53_007875 [Senna tora]